MDKKTTFFDKIINRFKNNPYIASFLVIGFILTSIVSFTGSMKSLIDYLTADDPIEAREKLSRISLKFTPEDFHNSVESDDITAVKLFLAAEMNPNITKSGNYNPTALGIAVVKNHERIIDILLEAGADVNKRFGYWGDTVLGRSTDKKLLTKLISYGANTESLNNGYVNAAEKGSLDLMQFFIEKGAKFEQVKEKALFKVANAYNHEKYKEQLLIVANYLLENGVDINAKNSNGMSVLQAALDNKNVSVAKLLIDKGADIKGRVSGGPTNIRSGTALMFAVRNGLQSLVPILIEKGADIHVKNYDGESLMMLAVSSRNYEVVKVLLEAGAENKGKSRFGYTILQSAVDFRMYDIIDLLLESGVSINDKTRKGNTALIMAAMSGQDTIVKRLIEYGADTSLLNDDGKSALYYAEKNKEYTIVNLIKNSKR